MRLENLTAFNWKFKDRPRYSPLLVMRCNMAYVSAWGRDVHDVVADGNPKFIPGDWGAIVFDANSDRVFSNGLVV